MTVQWNVAYLNVVYPNKSQVAESAKMDTSKGSELYVFFVSWY